MRTTRRLMILGAAGLAGASRASARPQPPASAPRAPHAFTASELLAIGRGALASAQKD